MRALFFAVGVFVPMLALAEEAAVPVAAAVAGSAAAVPPGSPVASLLPLVLIFFVFYFMLIRPQQKRMKQHQATLAALKKGDEVVTSGGIIGRIVKVNADDTLTVEIAKGIEVSVLRDTVSGLRGAPKAPASDKKKQPGDKNDNVLPSRDSIANDN
jgi:preprotein translocase subunit YajC